MEDRLSLTPVAYYHGPFGSKFGIPRQSSLAPVTGRIVFTPAFRVPEALRGLDGFGRIWLLWGFSANKRTEGEWQPVVRPPRLGGNIAVGVWASRSPYRPNPLGLSCVELVAVDGTELVVRGADLMDGTPVYDIKPYLPYADSYPDAAAGYATQAPSDKLRVVIPPEIPLDGAQRRTLTDILSLDPRPAYQDAPEREYGMAYEGGNLRFRVCDGTLTVTAYDKTY